MKKKTEKKPVEEQPEREKFWTNMNKWLEQELGSRGVTPGSVLPAAKMIENYESLSLEDKTAVDEIMADLNSDIEKKAVELLKNEIRDKIARTANINQLREAVKKGKHIEVKRKKGCIFLQLGTGEPNDQIEELLVAST